jgi:transposase
MAAKPCPHPGPGHRHTFAGNLPLARRLERGRFIWPSLADGTVAITPAQLGYLLRRRAVMILLLA